MKDEYKIDRSVGRLKINSRSLILYVCIMYILFPAFFSYPDLIPTPTDTDCEIGIGTG